ncbi:bacteriohemerythrin [Pseudaeromonas pectinilytica]|jgi:hemerythrin-like metal-binding domain|nr:hemerythrin family protein [Aeromonadaceae bacterium]MBP8772019.1 hemerythrin family protein [Aeromonadaceae bacterium]
MPVILEWSNQLATEHPLIDEQHQAMIAMINHLHICITEPMQRPEFSARLELLCNYAMEHFATEEQLMQQQNYPHLARHQAQHALLTQQAYALNQRFLGGDLPLDSTVSESLREWFMDHIQGEDRELGLFLLQQRTPPD